MKREKIFSEIHVENEARRLVLDLFLFFINVINEVKASGLQLQDFSFNVFR